MAKRHGDRPEERPRPFIPMFPLFLVYSDGEPIIGTDGATRFTMACATQELGELVVEQFKETEPPTKVDLRCVLDRLEFTGIARGLIEQGVTHMSWNSTCRSRTINVVGLADFTSL
jgi:hypothetical protein